MKGSAIIELENVWRIYHVGGVDIEALRGVSLQIKKGDFVAVTGPSGSGKSTIMSLIGVLDLPSRGKIFLDNKDISLMGESELATARGKKVGFVFQQFNLIQNLSALENVMLPMEFQDNNNAKKHAEELLSMVGLGDRIHHKPGQLSGGQQQRVAIARALANDPEVILADEPTGNLDSKSGKDIMDIFVKLYKDGKTIVLVTHDPKLVSYSERVIKLFDGKVSR